MISEPLLRTYRARIVGLEKGEPVFHQGDAAANFYIVRSGRVKMVTYSRDGKEFVQGYFTEGQSFGEPPFFHRMPYPASAVAVEAGEVWKCPREPFMKLLKDHFPIHLRLTEVLCERLMYKSMMLSELAVEEAEHRLTTIIEYFRKAERTPSDAEYRVPYTRQQLADMTGLRIETVIRCVKLMEQKGRLRLTPKGKVIWKKHLEKTP